MKKKELIELRAKEVGPLKKLVREKKLQLLKEKDAKKAWAVRRDIAQSLTMIREKELMIKKDTK